MVACVYVGCSAKGETVDSLFGLQAVKLLLNRETPSDTEKETINAALLPLYLNLCISELSLESPRKALKSGKKALEIDSANTKAHFRCGQVRPGPFPQPPDIKCLVF